MITQEQKDRFLSHYAHLLDHAETDYLTAIGNLSAAETRASKVRQWLAEGRPGWAESIAEKGGEDYIRSFVSQAKEEVLAMKKRMDEMESVLRHLRSVL